MVAALHYGASNSLEAGTPEPLFSLNGDASSGMFDISTDGQRVLTVAPQEQQRSESISVIQNWTAGLKRQLTPDTLLPPHPPPTPSRLPASSNAAVRGMCSPNDPARNKTRGPFQRSVSR